MTADAVEIREVFPPTFGGSRIIGNRALHLGCEIDVAWKDLCDWHVLMRSDDEGLALGGGGVSEEAMLENPNRPSNATEKRAIEGGLRITGSLRWACACTAASLGDGEHEKLAAAFGVGGQILRRTGEAERAIPHARIDLGIGDRAGPAADA